MTEPKPEPAPDPSPAPEVPAATVALEPPAEIPPAARARVVQREVDVLLAKAGFRLAAEVTWRAVEGGGLIVDARPTLVPTR